MGTEDFWCCDLGCWIFGLEFVFCFFVVFFRCVFLVFVYYFFFFCLFLLLFFWGWTQITFFDWTHEKLNLVSSNQVVWLRWCPFKSGFKSGEKRGTTSPILGQPHLLSMVLSRLGACSGFKGTPRGGFGEAAEKGGVLRALETARGPENRGKVPSRLSACLTQGRLIGAVCGGRQRQADLEGLLGFRDGRCMKHRLATALHGLLLRLRGAFLFFSSAESCVRGSNPLRFRGHWASCGFILIFGGMCSASQVWIGAWASGG